MAAAENYQEVRDERMTSTSSEKLASEKLLGVMKSHKLTEYAYEGKRITVVNSEKVRVRSDKDLV